MRRALADPRRRGDRGKMRSECRMRYAKVESALPHHLKCLVYDIYTEKNSLGEPIFRHKTCESFAALQQQVPPPTQAELEWNVPQHISPAQAHPFWLQSRSEVPGDLLGSRPINASDVLLILKHKTCTYPDRDILMKYHQRLGPKKPIPVACLPMCLAGHLNEDKGGATGIQHLLAGTEGFAESVGLVRLKGHLQYVACSPDYVLHMKEGNNLKMRPLEIKCPTEKFGARFNGELNTKHLLQVHIQLKALEADFGYILYWTREASYLFTVDFDVELWNLMEEGMEGWRSACIRGVHAAPQSESDKVRNKKVWARCEVIKEQISLQGKGVSLMSYVNCRDR